MPIIKYFFIKVTLKKILCSVLQEPNAVNKSRGKLELQFICYTHLGPSVHTTNPSNLTRRKILV